MRRCILCKKRKADTMTKYAWEVINKLISIGFLVRLHLAIKVAIGPMADKFWLQDFCSRCLIKVVRNYVALPRPFRYIYRKPNKFGPVQCPQCAYRCNKQRGLQQHITHFHISNSSLKGVSSQRMYQIRHRAAGLCSLCSRLIDRAGLCGIHYDRMQNRITKLEYGEWMPAVLQFRKLKKEARQWQTN